MSHIPQELRYTESHEWVRPDSDGTVVVGITDHAQEALGDLVFVELPEAGTSFAQGTECCVVESVKAASDVYAPVAGTVVASNTRLQETPELVNQDCYGDGWLVRLKPDDPGQVDQLLSAADYANVIDD